MPGRQLLGQEQAADGERLAYAWRPFLFEPQMQPRVLDHRRGVLSRPDLRLGRDRQRPRKPGSKGPFGTVMLVLSRRGDFGQKSARVYPTWNSGTPRC